VFRAQVEDMSRYGKSACGVLCAFALILLVGIPMQLALRSLTFINSRLQHDLVIQLTMRWSLVAGR